MILWEHVRNGTSAYLNKWEAAIFVQGFVQAQRDIEGLHVQHLLIEVTSKHMNIPL